MKKNSIKERKSVLYNETPILFGLPPVGSHIKVCKRDVNVLYERDNRIASEFEYKIDFSGKELEVLTYTKGIDNPLDWSNKCVCSYPLGDGIAITSFPTVQISVGTVRCFNVSDEEQEREYKSISRKA